jgi:hypothetical protein
VGPNLRSFPRADVLGHRFFSNIPTIHFSKIPEPVPEIPAARPDTIFLLHSLARGLTLGPKGGVCGVPIFKDFGLTVCDGCCTG